MEKELASQRNLLLSKDLSSYIALQTTNQPFIVPEYVPMDDEAEADRYQQLSGREIADLMNDI